MGNNRAISVLDVPYDTAQQLAQFVAVCYVSGYQGEDGFVGMPSGANAPKFAGFTQAPSAGTAFNPPYSTSFNKVSVRKIGASMAISNGAISYGDRLIIASAAGDVISVESELEAGTNPLLFVIGTAESSASGSGQPISVWIDPQVVPAG